MIKIHEGYLNHSRKMSLKDWDLLQTTKWDFLEMTAWDWTLQKSLVQWRLKGLNKWSRLMLQHRKPQQFEQSNTKRTFLHFLLYHVPIGPKLHWLKNKFSSLSSCKLNSEQYLLWQLDWYVLQIHWLRCKFHLQLQYKMTSKYSISVLSHLEFPPTATIDKLNQYQQSKVRMFLKFLFLANFRRLGIT